MVKNSQNFMKLKVLIREKMCDLRNAVAM